MIFVEEPSSLCLPFVLKLDPQFGRLKHRRSRNEREGVRLVLAVYSSRKHSVWLEKRGAAFCLWYLLPLFGGEEAELGVGDHG